MSRASTSTTLYRPNTAVDVRGLVRGIPLPRFETPILPSSLQSTPMGTVKKAGSSHKHWPCCIASTIDPKNHTKNRGTRFDGPLWIDHAGLPRRVLYHSPCDAVGSRRICCAYSEQRGPHDWRDLSYSFNRRSTRLGETWQLAKAMMLFVSFAFAVAFRISFRCSHCRCSTASAGTHEKLRKMDGYNQGSSEKREPSRRRGASSEGSISGSTFGSDDTEGPGQGR